MCNLFKSLAFIFLLTLPISIRATNIDCNGKGFICQDSSKFLVCVNVGDGKTETVNDDAQECPTGTTCDNDSLYECVKVTDSYGTDSTTTDGSTTPIVYSLSESFENTASTADGETTLRYIDSTLIPTNTETAPSTTNAENETTLESTISTETTPTTEELMSSTPITESTPMSISLNTQTTLDSTTEINEDFSSTSLNSDQTTVETTTFSVITETIENLTTESISSAESTTSSTVTQINEETTFTSITTEEKFSSESTTYSTSFSTDDRATSEIDTNLSVTQGIEDGTSTPISTSDLTTLESFLYSTTTQANEELASTLTTIDNLEEQTVSTSTMLTDLTEDSRTDVSSLTTASIDLSTKFEADISASIVNETSILSSVNNLIKLESPTVAERTDASTIQSTTMANNDLLVQEFTTGVTNVDQTSLIDEEILNGNDNSLSATVSTTNTISTGTSIENTMRSTIDSTATSTLNTEEAMIDTVDETSMSISTSTEGSETTQIQFESTTTGESSMSDKLNDSTTTNLPNAATKYFTENEMNDITNEETTTDMTTESILTTLDFVAETTAVSATAIESFSSMDKDSTDISNNSIFALDVKETTPLSKTTNTMEQTVNYNLTTESILEDQRTGITEDDITASKTVPITIVDISDIATVLRTNKVGEYDMNGTMDVSTTPLVITSTSQNTEDENLLGNETKDVSPLPMLQTSSLRNNTISTIENVSAAYDKTINVETTAPILDQNEIMEMLTTSNIGSISISSIKKTNIDKNQDDYHDSTVVDETSEEITNSLNIDDEHNDTLFTVDVTTPTIIIHDRALIEPLLISNSRPIAETTIFMPDMETDVFFGKRTSFSPFFTQNVNPFYSQSSGFYSDGTQITRSPTSNTWNHIKVNEGVPNDATINCQTSKTYPDEDTCHSYYICQDNMLYKLLCPYNTVYSPALQTCTTMKDQCSTRQNFNCPRQGFFPDPKSCYSYYECQSNDNGFKLNRYHCPWYSSYNPEHNQCVNSDTYCQSNYRYSHPQQTNVFGSTWRQHDLPLTFGNSYERRNKNNEMILPSQKNLQVQHNVNSNKNVNGNLQSRWSQPEWEANSEFGWIPAY